jgi:ADP-heptose:LPS heptosyltransferase
VEIADEVWSVNRLALEWDGALRDELRARVAGAGFSLVINPCFTRQMMLGDSVVRWSRAAERLGMVGDDALLPPQERRWSDGWYTRLVAMPRPWMHEMERHIAFLRALGAAVDDVPLPRLEVNADLGTLGLPRAYVAVAVGASQVEHRWPAARFAEVARAVVARTGWTPVLIGDARERALAQRVADLVPGAINLAGRTSLAQLFGVIQHARFVLSNDSAAVHIAAATGAHAVCLAGGWHWERFVPYPPSMGEVAARVHAVAMADEMPCFRCGGYCSLPHRAGEPRPCIENITVERALQAIDRLLPILTHGTDG